MADYIIDEYIPEYTYCNYFEPNVTKSPAEDKKFNSMFKTKKLNRKMKIYTKIKNILTLIN